MRLSYSSAARFFLFLVQWTDCNLAGALGLLRILIYLVFCLFSFHFFFSYVLVSNRLKTHSLLVCCIMFGLTQTYPDGKTTMSIYERKASIRDFYGE